jgi:endonuclease-3
MVSKTEFVAKKLLPRLRKQWPKTLCEVRHSNPLELLVGVILSAQSTDKRVNELTQSFLFKKYRKPEDYLKVPPEELEKDFRPAGFFRAKAANVRGACKTLIEKFGGKVPKTMDELRELPGVGRKTANVVLGAAYGIPSGIVVDTHMIRLATERLQLTRQKDPVKIEEDLTKLVPQKDWIYFSQAMVLHGRYICVARAPRCWECKLIDVCPYADKILAPAKAEKESAPRRTITGIPILPR